MGFDRRIQTESVYFKYALGRSEREGAEIHPYYEIIYFLGGKGDFLWEEGRLPLQEQSLMLIPKGAFHQFYFPDSRDYRRCILHFQAEPHFAALLPLLFSEVSFLSSAPKKIASLFSEMASLLSQDLPQAVTEVALDGFFLQLLAELARMPHAFTVLGHSSVTAANGQSPLVRQAVRYIEDHFREELSLEKIARALCVSPSLLSHAFREGLQVSVYRYVTEKRLLAAHKLLSEGVHATQVAAVCGFGEYSSFYRAYRKWFGCAPSQVDGR